MSANSISQGKRPAHSSDSLLEDHPDFGEGSQSDTDAVLSPRISGRRGTWGIGSSRPSQDGLGDWFKLKWWRKRWREEGDDDSGGGGGGHDDDEGRI